MALTEAQRDTLIRTIAGEAATEGKTGWAAVAHTIKNRTTDPRWPDDPAAVAKQPKQFSAWNKGAGGNSIPNSISAQDAIYLQIGEVVDGVFTGTVPDPTGGAVFYYAPGGMDNAAFGTAGVKVPKWLNSAAKEGPPREIGNHVFVGKAKSPTTALDARQAASGLQGFLPPSMVPEPRLRPDPSVAAVAALQDRPYYPFTPASSRAEVPGPLLKDQLDRPAGTPPVPPLSIPSFKPEYGVASGPYGADNVIKAALSNDAPALKAATEEALGLNSMFGMAAAMSRAPELSNYFAEFAASQPAVANQLAANLRGNPALLAAIPEIARESVVSALASPNVALPGSQVPNPTLRPTASAAAPAPTSYTPFSPAPKPTPTSYTPFSPTKSVATVPKPTSVADMFTSQTSYTPFSPVSKPSTPSGPFDVVPNLNTSEKSSLRGGTPQSYTPFSPTPPPAPAQTSYTPFSPNPPASITQQSFNERFDPTPQTSYTPFSPAPKPAQTSYTPFSPAIQQPTTPKPTAVWTTPPPSNPSQIINPEWTAWNAKVSSGAPGAWMTAAPPMYITVAAPAPKPVLSYVPAKPPVTAVTVTKGNAPPPPAAKPKNPMNIGPSGMELTGGYHPTLGYGTTSADVNKVYGSGGGGSSSSGSSSSTVLCTYYMKKGWLPIELWKADGRFAKTLPMAVRRGYWKWAIPTVRRLQKGAPVLEMVLWPVVRAWAQYAAYRMGVVDKFPLSGWLVHRVGTLVRA